MKVGNTKRVSCCLHVFFFFYLSLMYQLELIYTTMLKVTHSCLKGLKAPVQFTCLKIPFVQCISSSGYRAAAADAR